MIKTVSFSPRSASRAGSSRANSRVNTRAAAASSKMESPELKIETQKTVKPAKVQKSAAPLQTAVEVAPEIGESEPVPAKKASAEPKARRPRAPANLAEQYGAPTGGVPKAIPLAEIETPKKRLSKAEREARKELMRPSDELLQRLQRVEVFVPAKKKPQPRVAGWRFECGCCGRVTYFQTPGALCGCGAIAVKDGLT